MGRIGELDTDTIALTNRISAHARFGSNNLEEWIFGQIDVRPDHSVLEIGCGTGKQTIPLARLVGPAGRIRAVDIAEDSLARLRQSAEDEGLTDRIDLENCSIDDTGAYLREEDEFDRAVACYAVYYANDPANVFRAVHRKLRKGGSFFFCGPASNNNDELKSFHHRLREADIPAGAAYFMEGQGPALAAELFERVETSTFINPLTFNSAAAFYDYWRSYNLYDPRIDDRFRNAAEDHFSSNDTFVTHKRVIGILAVK